MPTNPHTQPDCSRHRARLAACLLLVGGYATLVSVCLIMRWEAHRFGLILTASELETLQRVLAYHVGVVLLVGVSYVLGRAAALQISLVPKLAPFTCLV